MTKKTLSDDPPSGAVAKDVESHNVFVKVFPRRNDHYDHYVGVAFSMISSVFGDENLRRLNV